MNRNKRYFWLPLMVLSLAGLFSSLAACQGASAQEIQGLLQALDGKEAVVTLGDGSTVRIEMGDDKLAAKASEMVGKPVEIKSTDDGKKMVGVDRLGEDTHATGNIESIGAYAFVIGGQTFKVDKNTRLDGGLAVGVPAKVEAVKLADGTLLATEIETENEEGQLAGQISAISQDTVVIDGKTFKLSAATRLDAGLAPGATARIEFVTMPDGSMVATQVETDQDDDTHLSGAISSLSPDVIVINGQAVKINHATMFDNGTGLNARVEVIKLADGTLLAKKIEFDRAEIEKEKEDLKRREQELERRENEIRGREDEVRGREEELRGRTAEGETEVRGQETEAGRGGGTSGGGVDDTSGTGSVVDDKGGTSGGGGSSGSSGSGSGGSG